MKLWDKLALKITNALLWRFLLIVLCVTSLLIITGIWVYGRFETQDAIENGRRLLIRLDTGAIEGKQAVVERPDSTTPNAQESSASSPAIANSPVNATAPATASEVSESKPSPAIAADNPNVQAISNAADEGKALILPGALPTATVPLANIKPTLTEKADIGILPVIGQDGTKPWHYYAKPYTHKGSLPMIAIVVTGLGQNKVSTEQAIRLPENISLSFSPYAKNIESWSTAARTAGHEIILDLPMEPSNYPASDPGPYGLMARKSNEDNASRLKWLMSRVRGYVGFITPQNEALSANDDAFKSLLDSLSARGLLLVVGHEPARDETKHSLSKADSANVTADALIDEELSSTAIQDRLAYLKKIATKRGYAIGIAQPFPLTLQELDTWSAALEKQGFSLVPVTFIANTKFPT